ncbi:hypothetical protein BJ138DRAFT_1112336 [Hygrophoropsis aurantiaca]|uniref:Uncharacterized protein n=1 Tax=Hygrophoropsis aurantiaca TaxID=72124 RepID=A0ACB8AGU8_9AGAM|nr:hypothetical protein BJ138DRAFT_1112336 [Hygrophoropsis aurantiaca]
MNTPTEAGPPPSSWPLQPSRRRSQASPRASVPAIQIPQARHPSIGKQSRSLQYTIERADVPWTPVTRPAPSLHPIFTAPASGPSYAQRLYASAFSNKPLLGISPDSENPPRNDSQSSPRISATRHATTTPMDDEQVLTSPQSAPSSFTQYSDATTLNSSASRLSRPLSPVISSLARGSAWAYRSLTTRRPHETQVTSRSAGVPRSSRPQTSYQPLNSPSSMFYSARPLERSMSLVDRSSTPEDELYSAVPSEPQDLYPSTPLETQDLYPSASFLNLEPTDELDTSQGIELPLEISATTSTPSPNEDEALPTDVPDNDVALALTSAVTAEPQSRAVTPRPPQYDTLVPPHFDLNIHPHALSQRPSFSRDDVSLIPSPSSSRSATPDFVPTYTLHDTSPSPQVAEQDSTSSHRALSRTVRSVAGPRLPSRTRNGPSRPLPSTSAASVSVVPSAPAHRLTRSEPMDAHSSASMSNNSDSDSGSRQPSPNRIAPHMDDRQWTLPSLSLTPQGSRLMAFANHLSGSSDLQNAVHVSGNDTADAEGPHPDIGAGVSYSSTQLSATQNQSDSLPHPISPDVDCNMADNCVSPSQTRSTPTNSSGHSSPTESDHAPDNYSDRILDSSDSINRSEGQETLFSSLRLNSSNEGDDVIDDLIKDLVGSMGLCLSGDPTSTLMPSSGWGDDFSEPHDPTDLIESPPISPADTDAGLSQFSEGSQLQGLGPSQRSYPRDRPHQNYLSSELYQGQRHIPSA